MRLCCNRAAAPHPYNRKTGRCWEPRLRGSGFFAFNPGLCPGLTLVPPLLHPSKRKSGARWGPRLRGWFDGFSTVGSTAKSLSRLRCSL